MQGRIGAITSNGIFAGTEWGYRGPGVSPSRGEAPERRTYRRLEVKYCEGCGALGLRPAGSHQVYCVTCDHSIGGAALSRRARRDA